MAQAGNEVIHETLKRRQDRTRSFETKMDELKDEMQAMRRHRAGLPQTKSIYPALGRHDTPLGHIERRLAIAEAAG